MRRFTLADYLKQPAYGADEEDIELESPTSYYPPTGTLTEKKARAQERRRARREFIAKHSLVLRPAEETQGKVDLLLS